MHFVLFPQSADDHVQLLLVGHICDPESDRQVSYDEGKQVRFNKLYENEVISVHSQLFTVCRDKCHAVY